MAYKSNVQVASSVRERLRSQRQMEQSSVWVVQAAVALSQAPVPAALQAWTGDFLQQKVCLSRGGTGVSTPPAEGGQVSLTRPLLEA